jgi:hypothetical protein
MTQEEFISLVKQPESVAAQHVSDLKEMVERFPYFVPSRILLTKSLQLSNSIHFEAHLKTTTVFIPSRRWLYYYLYPEKLLSAEPYRREKNAKSGGDYFDMLNVVESGGGDTRQSLKNLADKLKSARSLVNIPTVPLKIHSDKVAENIDVETSVNELDRKVVEVVDANLVDVSVSQSFEKSEANAKKLISERKYNEAIVILKELNLNNPKKSVYFADQIRFLEKVVSKSKK